MTKPTLVVVAAALLLGGTSLASAKNKGAAGAHSKPSRPSVNEVTPGPASRRSRRTRRCRTLTIDCPIPTMVLIRTVGYSTSMPCRLTAQVTPTAT